MTDNTEIGEELQGLPVWEKLASRLKNFTSIYITEVRQFVVDNFGCVIQINRCVQLWNMNLLWVKAASYVKNLTMYDTKITWW